MKTINYEREQKLLALPKSATAHFWERIISTGFCWRWQPHGGGRYGHFHAAGGRFQAHRAAWLISRGAIPKGLQVLHRCDHTKCVNPAHLFLGTQGDNMRDCARKRRCGLQRHPERSSLHQWNFKHAKLCGSDVPIIRELYHVFGFKQAEIAQLFGCCRPLISIALSGKRAFLTSEEIEALREIR